MHKQRETNEKREPGTWKWTQEEDVKKRNIDGGKNVPSYQHSDEESLDLRVLEHLLIQKHI